MNGIVRYRINNSLSLSVRQGTTGGEGRECRRILGIGNCDGRSSYEKE